MRKQIDIKYTFLLDLLHSTAKWILLLEKLKTLQIFQVGIVLFSDAATYPVILTNDNHKCKFMDQLAAVPTTTGGGTNAAGGTSVTSWSKSLDFRLELWYSIIKLVATTPRNKVWALMLNAFHR